MITTWLCSKNIALAARSHLERVSGIEPALSAWEAASVLRSATPVGTCDQEIRHLGSAALPPWVEIWVENRRGRESMKAGAAYCCSVIPDADPWLVAAVYRRGPVIQSTGRKRSRLGGPGGFRSCPAAERNSYRRIRSRRPRPIPCRQTSGQLPRRGPGRCAAWPVRGTTELAG